MVVPLGVAGFLRRGCSPAASADSGPQSGVPGSTKRGLEKTMSRCVGCVWAQGYCTRCRVDWKVVAYGGRIARQQVHARLTSYSGNAPLRTVQGSLGQADKLGPAAEVNSPRDRVYFHSPGRIAHMRTQSVLALLLDNHGHARANTSGCRFRGE